MGKPLMPDVIVNGKKISAAYIAAEAQNHKAPPGKPGFSWREAARALVVRELLFQAATEAGAIPAPEKLDETRIETDEEALVRAWMDQVVEPREVTDEDVERFYRKAPARYCSPDLFEASHILLAARPDDTEARARARGMAEEMIASLREDPAGFEELARKNSDCTSAENGGRLGQLRAGDTAPEFEAVLRTLEVGEIAQEPLETRFGVHVLRLDRLAEGRLLPFETVREQIHEDLEKLAWFDAARELVAELVRAADIEGIDMFAQTPDN